MPNSRSERAGRHEFGDEHDAAAADLVHLPVLEEADDVGVREALHQVSLLPEPVPLLLTQTVTAHLTEAAGIGGQ